MGNLSQVCSRTRAFAMEAGRIAKSQSHKARNLVVKCERVGDHQWTWVLMNDILFVRPYRHNGTVVVEAQSHEGELTSGFECLTVDEAIAAWEAQATAYVKALDQDIIRIERVRRLVKG